MGVGKNSNNSRKASRKTGLRRRLRVERLTERRVLAAITGTVFEDANFSFRQDAEESSLGGRLLYLDINNNAAIDVGEPYALGGKDGSFAFENLVDGTYQLRLYNGTDSQQQSFPVQPVANGKIVALENGIKLSVGDDTALALTDGTIEIADFEQGDSQSISVGTGLSGVQALSGGGLIVTGGEAGSETAWLVDPSTGLVEPLDLSGDGSSLLWSQVAIDGDGYGVALEQASESVVIRALDASDLNDGIRSSVTYHSVPADTQVITSSSGGRSVLAWAGVDGLQLSLWSNSTGTWIDGTAVDVVDASGLVAFDDDSGLLVLRSDDGGISVHDADANFATLKSLPDVTGPVALDAARDLLLTVSPESTLQLYDVRGGELIADLAVDLKAVGTVSDLQFDGAQQSLVVLGNEGMAALSLIAGSHQITIADDADPDPVMFGLALSGDNVAPIFESTPTLETLEDTSLIRVAPGVAEGAVDQDGDSIVIINTAPPKNGSAQVHPNGTLIYQPNPNFFGTDLFTVIAHDGRDNSGTFVLRVDILPVPDEPIGISHSLQPIPENAVPGHILGPLNVIDFDLNDNHQIELDDDRFVVHNGQLIFVGGELNFEFEQLIPLTVTVTDPEYSDPLVEYIYVQVADADDPITDIKPKNEFSVSENDAGAFVGVLEVIDEDGDANATLSVDDERFFILGDELKLVDGVSLDYEAEQVVFVNVTASDGSDSFTKQFGITVVDQPEPATSVELSNQSVMELSPGHEVGNVTVNGHPPLNSYNVFVNDPRFEIVDAKLKLVDNQWVDRTTQEEIQITITAQDVGELFATISETFVIEITENQTPYHNDDSPFDVDDNGNVSAGDALAIINYLNIYGPGPIGSGDPGYGYDVNADGFVTALDALLILNELNVQSLSNSTVGGEKEGPEGEQVQPEHLAPQQPEQLILPQRIASAEESDEAEYFAESDQSFAAQSDRPASAKFAGSSLIAADDAGNHEQVLRALSSETNSDEFTRQVDEALQAVVRSSLS